MKYFPLSLVIKVVVPGGLLPRAGSVIDIDMLQLKAM